MEVRASVSAMRVKQIKAELDSLGVAHRDAVEKVDLVERLVQARLNPPAASVAPTAPPPPAAPPPAPPPATPPPVPEVFTEADLKEMERKLADDPVAAASAFDNIASNLGVDQDEAMAQAQRMMDDPAGAALMQEMAANPRVMAAAMDIAMNGEAAAEKYANDSEVLALLQKMERLGFTE